EERVALLGFMENAAALLKAFDVFLVSSVKEGLPYAVIEAGFAGLPTVATSVGGIPEQIAHLRSGVLVDPKDAKGLAGAVRMLMSEKKKAEMLGENFEKWTREGFALEKMVARTKTEAYGL
ncbi:MAG: glycosyltransferase family 4 protein, partial [bacterium]|nr:glycosyltransferase family 4 protein [bacterium]